MSWTKKAQDTSGEGRNHGGGIAQFKALPTSIYLVDIYHNLVMINMRREMQEVHLTFSTWKATDLKRRVWRSSTDSTCEQEPRKSEKLGHSVNFVRSFSSSHISLCPLENQQWTQKGQVVPPCVCNSKVVRVRCAE